MTKRNDYMEELFINGLIEDGFDMKEAQAALENEKDWNGGC